MSGTSAEDENASIIAQYNVQLRKAFGEDLTSDVYYWHFPLQGLHVEIAGTYLAM